MFVLKLTNLNEGKKKKKNKLERERNNPIKHERAQYILEYLDMAIAY